ncbi:hypothetical protein H2200_002688 [Cladophialophora chaetospira]|uniref:SET domain-containing protein n=1 Tax=Cladophialophora chaetospira TaxID=386627 RepID=A0AA38XJF7_9EURO|nr:hypothetical protein H2200_002688 [Cladophialophora chaetospira]
MDNEAPADSSSLPRYLQDILSRLPDDHAAALCSPNGPSIADTIQLTDRRRRFAYLLLARHRLTQRLAECPGPCPELILDRAKVYEALGYSELALADAYVSYTLCLVALDGPDISDLVPVDSDGEPWPNPPEEGNYDQVNALALKHKYRSLMLLCRSAINLGAQTQAKVWIDEIMVVKKGLRELDGDQTVDKAKDVNEVIEDMREYFTIYEDEAKFQRCVHILKDANHKPTLFGWCQRQVYPWNEHEPDRMSKKALKEINDRLHEAAPDLEVEISTLPTLSLSLERGAQRMSIGESEPNVATLADCSSQLGLFAKKEVKPGTTILKERSVLTGIRPHGEALCDGCAADLEGVDQASRRYCPGCNTPFCSEECQSAAKKGYHAPNMDDYETDEGYPPAEAPFCPGTSGNEDIHNLGRAESSTTPEWDLYFLLLSRTMQMSVTQKVHPLDLFEIKYLWGDFSPTPNVADLSIKSGPKTLPYSVRHHVELPLQWFEILMHSRDRCTPYSATWLEKYDWWIVQTLFAKFRGVADAQQSTWTGKPEVAAVHPLWCLANHSCNPNVTWKPSGVRNLTVVKDRIWERPGQPSFPWEGIRAGEEIWNHYTDVQEKDYRERQARLQAVLGGDCRCSRCAYESRPRPGSARGGPSSGFAFKSTSVFPIRSQPDGPVPTSQAGLSFKTNRRVSPTANRQTTRGVALIPSRPPLLFALFDPTGAVYNPSIAYPYRPAIFNSLTAGLLGSLIPLGVIIASQLFFRSFADYSAAHLGLTYALAAGTCFQIILKKTIGGLRPHFLAVCKPKLVAPGSGLGFNGIMYRVQDVCTGTKSEIDWGIQSFPSGHSEIAFAGLGYLAIYLFTHLRLSDRSRTTKLGF